MSYYYLDDSGDPGLGGAKGSSRYLVLAMVQLAKEEPLSALASVRQLLHLPKQVEFKYYKTRERQKKVFFKSIQSLPFRVRAVVIEKSQLEKRFTKMSGPKLMMEFITHLTLRASELDIANDVLVIDGATKAFCRALRVRLSQECRKQDRVRPFKKIVGGDSKREDGLQLADMIAGAIREHIRAVERSYYHTFESKVADLWVIST